MRKTMIIATAIAALAAFALPASAGAYTSKWKDGGNVLTENGTWTITATWAFTGGTQCEDLHIHATLTAGTGTGHIETWDATNCVPTETLAALGCEEVEVEAEGLPWMLDDEGSRIRVSGLKTITHLTGGAFCPNEIAMEDDKSGGLYIVPNNTEAMSSVTFSGSLSTSLGTQEVSGSGSVSPSGTYGL